jgi:hypothetical protein
MKNSILVLFSLFLPILVQAQASVPAELRPVYFNVNGGEVTNDADVINVSLVDVIAQLRTLQEQARIAGWNLEQKYGILEAKDIQNFKTFDSIKLATMYNSDLLRRFAQSLKLPVTGTKKVLTSDIQRKVLSIQ